MMTKARAVLVITEPGNGGDGDFHDGKLCEASGNIPQAEVSQTMAIRVFSSEEEDDDWRETAQSGVSATLDPSGNGDWSAENVPDVRPGDNYIYAVRYPLGWPMTPEQDQHHSYNGNLVENCNAETNVQLDDKILNSLSLASNITLPTLIRFFKRSIDLVDSAWLKRFQPSPPMIEPATIEDGWLHYRGINPRGVTLRDSATTLGHNGTALRASRLEVVATKVEWERVLSVDPYDPSYPATRPTLLSPHGIRILSPSGLSAIAVNSGYYPRWTFPALPQFAVVVNQDHSSSAPQIVTSENEGRPNTLGLHPHHPIQVSVNSPQFTFWANPGSIDLAVRVVAS